jgi:hypothetical protein
MRTKRPILMMHQMQMMMQMTKEKRWVLMKPVMGLNNSQAPLAWAVAKIEMRRKQD